MSRVFLQETERTKGGPIVAGRRFSVCIGAPGTMAQDFILDAENFIFDSETRKNVAVIRNGAVFRDNKEGARIAYLIGSSLYDLNGNFLGRLDGCARSFPIGLRKLLEANSKGFGQGVNASHIARK
jgi:hypothetical protein